MKPKTLAFAIAFISAPVFAAIVGGELWLRSFGSTPAQLYKCRDEWIHHKMVPGSTGRVITLEYRVIYRANSDGFRGRDYPLEKRSGTFRIVVLGDSFTWGQGVPERHIFTSLLRDRLNEKHGGNAKSFEVINLAMQSHSPIVQYIVLKKLGLRYSPDLVVLCLDWSDLQDDLLYGGKSEFDESGRPVKITPPPEPPGGLSFLGPVMKGVKKTYLYHSIRERLKSPGPPPRDNYGILRYDRYALLREPPAESMKHHYERTQKYILMIRDICKENHLPFLLVLYPYGHQVNRDEWKEGRKLFGFEEGTVCTTRPFEIMAEFAKEAGIYYVNQLPAFRASDDFPLYFPVDGHLTKAGHELFAAGLLAKLEKENWRIGVRH